MPAVHYASFVIVGILWGTTTPFVKAAISQPKLPALHPTEPTFHRRILFHLFGPDGLRLMDWRVLLPYTVNQMGSVLFMYILGHSGNNQPIAAIFSEMESDMSKAVPIANALAAFFTFTTELFLFRTVPDWCE